MPVIPNWRYSELKLHSEMLVDLLVNQIDCGLESGVNGDFHEYRTYHTIHFAGITCCCERRPSQLMVPSMAAHLGCTRTGGVTLEL